MGIDPITTAVGLGVVAVGAYALYLAECEKEERRRQERDIRRRSLEAREREKEARRREKEKEREEKARRKGEEIEREKWKISRWQEEDTDQRCRRNAMSNITSDDNYRMKSTSQYYPSHPYYYRFENQPSFSFYDRYSPEEYGTCRCFLCSLQARPITENSCNSPRSQPENFNLFDTKKNFVTVTLTPPQTTQDKNQNAKNQGSNNRPSSSNSQDATTSNSSGNTFKQNKSYAPKATSAGSQQPQRNNNNNNQDNKKDAVQDYGKLNDFIKKLKAVLDRCNASAELREKILSFFNKFEKHEENFLRLLEDYRIQNIDIEDILLIVIQLFQSDCFAKDVAYENFIALMEFVAKYIIDETISEVVEVSLRGNKKPFEQQRVECMKKVLERNNVLTEIMELFEKLRKEIINDNANKPLELDFFGIFTKVYHYFKHKDVRGKEWTVTEYFDWIRKLLISLKDLNPEYAELTNVNHTRREINFEVYSTVFQGRFRIVIRAYGPRLNICTFFFKNKYDKKAKDGDKYVDGKKKP